MHRDLGTHRSDLDRDRRLLAAGWQRCGWTAAEVLRRGSTIIASADAALSRTGDPARTSIWRSLVSESLYSSAGRARAQRRWRSNG